MAGTFNLDKITATLAAVPEQFAGKQAEAGWYPSAKHEDGTSVAYVATIQEHGAPEVGIPARPFMRPAVQQHKDEWTELMADGVRAVLAGRADADQVLEAVGAQVAGDIQDQIVNGGHRPLSPTTLVLRKWAREGRTITGKTVGEAAAAYEADPSIIQGVPDDPLQDTGLMVATLTSTVGSSE